MANNMIRILCNSKTMAKFLESIDFENDWVVSASTDREAEEFSIKLQSGREKTMHVGLLNEWKIWNATVPLCQSERYWANVFDTCKRISEQPISLFITEKKIDIILQY